MQRSMPPPDHQIGERQIDLGSLDLNSIVGKSGPAGIAAPSASSSPTNPGLTRYRWTQTAMDAGREEEGSKEPRFSKFPG